MRTEPRGYWTRVFDQAATLLKARPELNGDSAYWIARRMVDQSLAQPETEAASVLPGLRERMAQTPVLMLG
jgi:hypothetical protein